MTFVKGQSGNPRGKLPGQRNKATEMAEELMRKSAEAIMRTVCEAAVAGDMAAARMVVDRLVPIRRGRPVKFDLPKGDVVEVLTGVVAAVSNGDLSPDEGQSVAAIIEGKRRAIESAEFEERLSAVEKMLSERR